jgi:hypothetical protein
MLALAFCTMPYMNNDAADTTKVINEIFLYIAGIA